jgi:PKD repeat protein
VQFLGEASLNADSFDWVFGDGNTSVEENPVHRYDAIGEYNVTLTVNGTLSTSERIKILPDGQLPYVKGVSYYGGSFEDHTEQYGVHTVSGSGFERGNSGISGKNGTKSGDYAYVIGLNEPTYQENSESYLYLPVFDFTDESIYTFSFWARYFLHPGPDGFLIEYTANRGRTWQALGSSSDKKWYNFNNTDVATSAFPEGTSYFTQEVGGYTNYTHDLSFLSGTKDVAFRFVFRSEATGRHVGLAIDDVEILAYQGELRTMVQGFSGEFGTNKDIELDWSTNPEYYCKKFEIERSTNGIDFEKIDEVQAKSILSASTTTYMHTSSGGRDLYFYRLKVTNENANEGYFYEFYSDTITLRRNAADPITVHGLYPNPFIDQINITFDGVVDQTVTFEVFDAVGKRILERSAFINTPFYTLPLAQWPHGVYYLSIKIGSTDEKVYPILSARFE